MPSTIGIGRRQVAAKAIASNMVLSPISARETRLIEIRTASKTHSIAGPRRTDEWRSQPDPAWNRPCEASGLARFLVSLTLDALRLAA